MIRKNDTHLGGRGLLPSRHSPGSASTFDRADALKRRSWLVLHRRGAAILLLHSCSNAPRPIEAEKLVREHVAGRAVAPELGQVLFERHVRVLPFHLFRHRPLMLHLLAPALNIDRVLGLRLDHAALFLLLLHDFGPDGDGLLGGQATGLTTTGCHLDDCVGSGGVRQAGEGGEQR